MGPLKKDTRVKMSAAYLFPSSFSVITTSLMCQYASPFTFFPSLGVWPRQIPAMSPRFLDENSNLSTFPLKTREEKKQAYWTSTRLKPPPYFDVTPQSICSARNKFFFF